MIICLDVNRHLVSGHEISRLQHSLQLIMAGYTRIINRRPCCNLYVYPSVATPVDCTIWARYSEVPLFRGSTNSITLNLVLTLTLLILKLTLLTLDLLTLTINLILLSLTLTLTITSG